MPLTADPLVDTLREEIPGLPIPKNKSTEAEALSKVKAGETTTGIFTPYQMRLPLDSAPAKMIPFLAHRTFAGLRPTLDLRSFPRPLPPAQPPICDNTRD